MSDTPEHPISARWSIAARVLAAAAGGYLLSNAASAAIAGVLPLPRADAVMAGILLSFLIYLLAILWSFAARSAKRACVGVALAIGASLLVLSVAGQGGV